MNKGYQTLNFSFYFYWSIVHMSIVSQDSRCPIPGKTLWKTIHWNRLAVKYNCDFYTWLPKIKFEYFPEIFNFYIRFYLFILKKKLLDQGTFCGATDCSCFGLCVSFLIGFKSRVDLSPALFLAYVRWTIRSCLVRHLPFPPIGVY